MKYYMRTYECPVCGVFPMIHSVDEDARLMSCGACGCLVKHLQLEWVYDKKRQVFLDEKGNSYDINMSTKSGGKDG